MKKEKTIIQLPSNNLKLSLRWSETMLKWWSTMKRRRTSQTMKRQAEQMQPIKTPLHQMNYCFKRRYSRISINTKMNISPSKSHTSSNRPMTSQKSSNNSQKSSNNSQKSGNNLLRSTQAQLVPSKSQPRFLKTQCMSQLRQRRDWRRRLIMQTTNL